MTRAPAAGATPGDWNDTARYARLRGIDRAGIMWEWLRRDPEYVAWYTRASAATRGAEPVDGALSAQQWGIHFR